MSTITRPTLLVHAREDDMASLSNAVHIQRHLGGLVDTVVLDDSYHLVTIDRQNDIVVERSASFARRLALAASAREHDTNKEGAAPLRRRCRMSALQTYIVGRVAEIDGEPGRLLPERG